MISDQCVASNIEVFYGGSELFIGDDIALTDDVMSHPQGFQARAYRTWDRLGTITQIEAIQITEIEDVIDSAFEIKL